MEAYDILTNESAPDVTILLLKDSYSAPIGTFMSLLARHVVCVDLRKDSQSLEEWEKTKLVKRLSCAISPHDFGISTITAESMSESGYFA